VISGFTFASAGRGVLTVFFSARWPHAGGRDNPVGARAVEKPPALLCHRSGRQLAGRFAFDQRAFQGRLRSPHMTWNGTPQLAGAIALASVLDR
jgi:hypothetical protein